MGGGGIVVNNHFHGHVWDKEQVGEMARSSVLQMQNRQGRSGIR